MPCQATTKSGRPCQAPPRPGRDWCYHHDPENAAERLKARRKGGLSLHYGSGGPERAEVSVRKLEDVLRLLEEAASDLLTQKPSSQRARGLVSLAATALRAVAQGDVEERLTALEARLQIRVTP